ncbi:MAG: hypothetical protein JKY34_07265 [Kordiimonadaceae bacterium]|nr:hypothetical protein [Kordiimonadaceae bacterium]
MVTLTIQMNGMPAAPVAAPGSVRAENATAQAASIIVAAVAAATAP